jgi:hypothetical protein
LTDFLGEADNARHHALWRRTPGDISMSVESFTPTALQFTHGAAHKVKSLVDEEGMIA